LLFLPTGTLANKVKRKDTLAIKLGNTTTLQEEKIVFPRKSKEEWNEIRHQIGTTLIRYEEWRRVLSEPLAQSEGWHWAKLLPCLSWNVMGPWALLLGQG